MKFTAEEYEKVLSELYEDRIVSDYETQVTASALRIAIRATEENIARASCVPYCLAHESEQQGKCNLCEARSAAILKHLVEE